MTFMTIGTPKRDPIDLYASRLNGWAIVEQVKHLRSKSDRSSTLRLALRVIQGSADHPKYLNVRSAIAVNPDAARMAESLLNFFDEEALHGVIRARVVLSDIEPTLYAATDHDTTVSCRARLHRLSHVHIDGERLLAELYAHRSSGPSRCRCLRRCSRSALIKA